MALEVLFEMIGALFEFVLCDLFATISEYSGNKNDRGKGKLPSDKYVTR